MAHQEERWSAEQRRRALELAAEHGATRASEMSGIPSGTIHSWRHRLARAALAAAEVVDRDAGRTWVGSRRDRALVELADTYDLAQEKLQAALARGTSKQARDLVIVAGTLFDKLELASGGVSSRSESLAVHADARRSAEELLDELGARGRRENSTT
jgi:transposase-like protein